MRKFAVSLLVVVMLVVLAVPAFAEVEVMNKGADDITIGGYLRFVGWIWDNDEGLMKNNDSFSLEDARIAVKGNLPNNFSFKIQGDFAPDEVKLKDGYLKWTNDEKTFYILGGQFFVPFSMSETTSTTKLWTIDRPMVVGALAPGRDIGMAVGGTFDTESDWNWVVGAWNGTGGWSEATDDNDPFIVGGRLEYGQRDDFLIGLDVTGGAQGGGSSSDYRYDLLLVGGHVAIQWDDNNEDEVNEWMFEGEYLYREIDDSYSYEGDETWESDGWWAMIGYWFNPMWHGHLQVDSYDSNNDIDDNEYTDFTFGFSYHWMSWLDPHHEKVVFEYIHRDEAGDDYDDDILQALWQLTY